MDSPYRRELEVAFSAIQVAARLSQHIITSQDKGIVEKEDLSPVTVADFAIQALLTATIQHAFPGDNVVGEENASELRADLLLLEHVYELLRWVAGYGDSEAADEARAAFPADCCRVPKSREHMCNLIDECGSSGPAKEGRTWVIDPIDGTKTYVRGELYAINVALLVDGKQAVGVVGCPNMSMDVRAPLLNADIDPSGCIVFAVKDHGAFVRPLDGSIEEAEAKTRRLTLHDPDLTVSDLRFVTSVTLTDSALAGVHEAFAKSIDVPYPGCDLLPWVLRWTGLALGLGNTTIWAYKRIDRLGKIWDHAGAMLLFEETGGHITDVHGKAIDLTAGRKMKDNYGFVAAPGKLHSEVLERLHVVMRDMGHEAFLEPKKEE